MEGLYISVSGMLTSQNDLVARSNNISNSETVGYKFDRMVEKVYEKGNAYKNGEGGRGFIGDYYNKVVNQGTNINLKAGNTELTNNRMNVAILDEQNNATTFFVVDYKGEKMLTRNGDFQVNEIGELKTDVGAKVLDENSNPIIIPKDANPIINSSGDVSNFETGEIFGRVQLKSVIAEQKINLNKEQAAMFTYEGDIGQLTNSNAALQTGVLEQSNVDLSEELVGLLQTQREFQSNQKVFSAYDKILEKEANQILK